MEKRFGKSLCPGRAAAPVFVDGPAAGAGLTLGFCGAGGELSRFVEARRAALDRLGVKPGDALFCGDTVLDAGAAKNAGTHFAAVLLGTTPAEAFARFFPDHTSPDLWDLAAWLGL